ncbi:hypothetical protein O181_006093 [Austropuccinia psidii MF-1]|uniref:Reverse transcriptase domain-containing protein n=1 Tax=Austropuccinia psidii MF-1 TaxID=1389203 RepID=A0A9Q3BJT4_9BASI|nr:hypothetical protein [Austropuccinia psidii MF-1]
MIPLIIMDTSDSPSLCVTYHTKYNVDLRSFPRFEWDFLVIDTPKGDSLILGFDFFNSFNQFIDWRQGSVTFNSDDKEYYDPSKSSSNNFLSSKSCAAIDVHLLFGNINLPPSSFHESLGGLWDEEEEPEEIETVIKVVPSSYHQYLDVFSKVKAENPPPHHACDHNIELVGSLPPVGVIYVSPNQESDTLRPYISGNVEKGFIWPSSASTGAPVLFVKKKDCGLHLCVDYHKLNGVTGKNKYPIPPMNQFLTVFNGPSIFSKIDLHGAYNLLRIKESDEHLTCFRTKHGSYEYFVIPFGLTNAPASFQNLVNDIFYDLLNIYVVVYLDEIMVFSKTEEEHITHVSTVLSILRANNLFAKASKCLFHVSSVVYLGYIVSSEGLKMKQAKVQQILNWPSPRNLNALQLFLGLANFTKELLGIVWALKHWRAFSLSLSSSFEVLTYHSSLQYFISSKILTRCQASWAEFLSEFHFSITYHPGHLVTLPDALSCQDNIYPERGEDFISKNPMNYQKIIKQNGIQAPKLFAFKVDSFSNSIDSIQEAL